MTTTVSRVCFAVLAVGVIASMASGCTSNADGVAQPTGSSLTRSQSGSLAPQITAKHLDLTAAKANPCSIVPASALVQFDIDSPGVVKETPAGPSCIYKPDSINRPLLSVIVFTQTGGLEGSYQRRASFNRFETGTLRGYPTVLALQGSPQLGQAGVCSISVAVNEAELINVDFDVLKGRKYYTDPCAPTNEVLSLALQGVGG